MSDRRIKVLKMISEDMKSDAESFDRMPFNGRVVAEYFGKQGAAIDALAEILQTILKED